MNIISSHRTKQLCSILLAAITLGAVSSAVHALDLLPDIFSKPKIIKALWKEQEQFVALTPQGTKGETYPANAHPITLDGSDIEAALKSLQLWDKGGFFRNEESHPVFSGQEGAVLGRYISESLQKAKPNEDVIFTIRGYDSVAFDVAKERQWSSGRVFFVNGKLNLIIGTFKLKKDRGIRNAEASAGIIDNYDDLYFDPGWRSKQTGKMPGRIVASSGITYLGGEKSSRPDWVLIDVKTAALAYRNALIPEEQKKSTEKAKQDSAKLTLERREMREEMARLRQQLKELQAGSGGAKSVEERLSTLEALLAKKMISQDEYQRRRTEILKDI